MHMVTKTYQLRDGEKLTEFYNCIDWKPLFEFVQRYYGIGVEQPPVPCLKPNGRIEVHWPEVPVSSFCARISDGTTSSPPLSEQRRRCTNSTARSPMR